MVVILPNIIKLPQTVRKLWPAQDFGIREDKYIMEKVRVLLNRTCYWSLSMHLPNIIKIFQTCFHTQEFGLEIHLGEVTGK